MAWRRFLGGHVVVVNIVWQSIFISNEILKIDQIIKNAVPMLTMYQIAEGVKCYNYLFPSSMLVISLNDITICDS